MTAPLQPLSHALAQARRDLARQTPPAAAAAALQARWRTLQAAAPAEALGPGPGGLAVSGRSRVRLRFHWGLGVGAGLATLAMVAALLWWGPPRAAPATPVPAAGPAAWAADSGFLPLVSDAEWRRTLGPDHPAAVYLVPTRWPRERLALLGLPYDPTRAEQPVDAELMVHPNGQLLAVRFVQ